MKKSIKYEKVPEELIEEGKKLMELSDEEIYLLLGTQILGQEAPTKVAGITTYISAIGQLDRATKFVETLPSEKLLPESVAGIATLMRDLTRKGRDYFVQTEEVLKRAICTKEGELKKEILDSLDKGIESLLKVLTPIIGVTMGLTGLLYPIAVTIGVIVIKMGLKNFCKLG